ncbi:unnamed protein product [Cylicocyclus nassatus]|uniref:Uncharacterized protein n=1 Tax=Cylicocyclus nassatus TaxID=53992 RepID=A0AA36M4I7_CYLNA|nr:unnamed protein product [Cylicocyclus nassatus]
MILKRAQCIQTNGANILLSYRVEDLSTDSLEFRYTQKVLAFNFVSHSYGLMKGWMSISAFEQRRAQEPLM